MVDLKQNAQDTAYTDEELSAFNGIKEEYTDAQEEELYSLLEEILIEVFVQEEDCESLDYLTGKSIYDLADDKEISLREKKAEEELNEGYPDVDQFDELLELAEEYFKSPNYYPLAEDDYTPTHITGFIQINCGYKTDKKGNISEYWKSTDHKIQIESCLLMEPEKVIELIESRGFVFNELTRIVFYGTPLSQFVESKIYSSKDSKEIVPLSESYLRILLAVPNYEETQEENDSIYDWANHIIQEEVSFSGIPLIGRAYSHWEMTESRLEVIAEEQHEEKLLNLISLKERKRVKGQNNFWEKFKNAKEFISGFNSGNLTIKVLSNSPVEELERIQLLCDKYNFRINSPSAYMQIKSIITNSKLKTHFNENQLAISTIQKINKGELVELHLLSHDLLEEVFSILWGNLGIRIIPERKEIYHSLKARLFQLRKVKQKKFA